jgi:hypothetical protein
MKTSKNKPVLTLLALSLISIIAVFTSCTSSNNNNDVPPAHVMVVNTVKGSAAQTLKLNNNTVNTTAVAYGQGSAYVTELPGSDNAQFFNSGSATVNASFSITLNPNSYYTIYYAGNDTTNTAYTAQDNLTIPSGGFASVQFINFSAASAFDFGVTGSSKIASAVATNTASAFYSIPAKTAIAVYVSGSLTAILAIPADFQSGMIYTVYITGSSKTDITYHIVSHNPAQS